MDYFWQTPLYLAARNGHRLVVEVLLNSGVSAFETPAGALLPIEGAAMSGDYAIVDLLLQRGAKPVHCSDQYGFTTLHTAASSGCLMLVQMMVEDGSNPNTATWSGSSAAVLAARKGHREVTAYLLQHASSPPWFSKVIHSPLLHYTSSHGWTDMAETLLRHGADVNRMDWGFTSLHGAAKSGHTQTAKILIAHGARTDARDPLGRTPVHLAVTVDSSEVIALFPRYCCDIASKDGVTPLMSAVKNNAFACMNVLLGKGVHANALESESPETALASAVWNGAEGPVRTLLNRGADVNLRREGSFRAPLLYAAEKSSRLLGMILEVPGLDIGICDSKERSALHIAIEAKSLPNVHLLLEAGVGPLATDSAGQRNLLAYAKTHGSGDILEFMQRRAFPWEEAQTCTVDGLQKCMTYETERCLQELLGTGIDPLSKDEEQSGLLHCNVRWGPLKALLLRVPGYKMETLMQKNNRSETPLHVMTQCSDASSEVIGYLISNGCNKNEPDGQGLTPIFRALNSRNDRFVKILLRHAVDFRKRNPAGQYPWHIAHEQKNASLEKMLNIPQPMKDRWPVS